jgi:hypothetical protein
MAEGRLEILALTSILPGVAQEVIFLIGPKI